MYGSDFITPSLAIGTVHRIDETLRLSSNMVNRQEGVMKSDPYKGVLSQMCQPIDTE